MSLSDQAPFENIDEAPLGDEFLAFMDQEFSQSGARYHEISEWMQKDLTSDSERILSAFTLVATGCFNRGEDVHVAGNVVNRLDTIHDITDSDVKESLAGDIHNPLEAIDSEAGRWDWLHGHRKNIHFRFSEAGSIVAHELSELAEIVGHYEDVAEYFEDTIASQDDPFYSIFNDVKDISEFGRLSAFNFLEIADTAARIDGLTPEIPRVDYIKTANPQPGFFYVFLADGPEDDRVADMEWDEAADELGVDDDGLDALVTLLCEAAKDTLDWSEEHVMYDVESCLCIFAKKPKNRMLKLGGDGDDSGTTRSGC